MLFQEDPWSVLENLGLYNTDINPLTQTKIISIISHSEGIATLGFEYYLIQAKIESGLCREVISLSMLQSNRKILKRNQPEACFCGNCKVL